MPERLDSPAVAWVIAGGFMAAAVIFTVWPRIDIAVSSLFFRAETGFFLSGNGVLGALRQGVWHLSEAMIVLAAVGLVLSAFGKTILGIAPRIWAFVMLLYLAVPALLANVVFKSHWGRARPVDISEFGGALGFSPALVPSDQCLRNCSFISGEGSAAVALAVAALVVVAALRDRWSVRLRLAASGLAITVGFVGSALRLVTGRHFLSDTVFAALFVFAAAFVLARLLQVGAATTRSRGRSAGP